MCPLLSQLYIVGNLRIPPLDLFLVWNDMMSRIFSDIIQLSAIYKWIYKKAIAYFESYWSR